MSQWLEDQWNEPDRSDHYAMQIAQKVDQIARMLAQNTQSTKLDDFEIPFEHVITKTPEQKAVDKTAMAKAIKGVWGARIGVKDQSKVNRRKRPTP